MAHFNAGGGAAVRADLAPGRAPALPSAFAAREQHRRRDALRRPRRRDGDRRLPRVARACPRASPCADRGVTSQVAEHVAISNGNLHARLGRRLLGSPLDGRTPDVLDIEIPYLFYRGDEPPNVGKPSGAWTDPREALEKL